MSDRLLGSSELRVLRKQGRDRRRAASIKAYRSSVAALPLATRKRVRAQTYAAVGGNASITDARAAAALGVPVASAPAEWVEIQRIIIEIRRQLKSNP